MKEIQNNEKLITKLTRREMERERKINLLIEYKKEHGNFEKIQDKEIREIVYNIRSSKNGGKRIKLTDEMLEKLEEIGFTWGEGQGGWFNSFYEKLIAYKKEKGSFFGVTQDKDLGLRVKNIRMAYKGKGETRLTPEMIDKLNAIGFTWEADFGRWFDSFYEKLVAYKEKNGNFHRVTKDEEIGNAVHNVRCAYKKEGNYKLTPEMIDKLNAIGFTWEADFGYWFDSFYEKLIDYKKKRGSFCGVTHDPEIGGMVGRVRRAYKGAKSIELTPTMIDKLNEIDFAWEAEYGDWFEPFYIKLIEYKNSHNGTFDGATQDREIGLKVSSVRKAYKGTGAYRLTPEMIDKLNEIGFPWDARFKKEKEDTLSV